MLKVVAFALVILLTLVACGEASPVQQTEDAYREQTKQVEQVTKEVEKLRDKLHKGWDEDELIRGDHCEEAEDKEYNAGFQLLELVRAEVDNPKANLSEDDFKYRTQSIDVMHLTGADIRKFDIQMSESDVENIKAGGRMTPLRVQADFADDSQFKDIWTDRPKHEAKLDFWTESDGYRHYTALGFVDHWTCEAKLLKIKRSQ